MTIGQLPRPDGDLLDLLRQHRIAQERRGNLTTSIDARDIKLRAFAAFLAPRSLLEATRVDVEEFLDARRHPVTWVKINPRTRYAWLSHFHAFYRWALVEELVDKDPTAAIVRPKVRRTLPRPIPDDELARALAEAPANIAAMIALAAYQGLRCKELANLDRSDILDGRDPPLLVVTSGKGGHERILPLHPEALAALRRMPMPKASWIFNRPMGGKHSPQTMSATIRNYLRSIGVDATAHQLRHWFATSIYAQTHDIRLTQELLGHQSPNTTAIYVAWAAVDAAAAVGALKIRG